MGFNKNKIIYIASSLLILFISFMSYREHFVIYGDAILQLSKGRDFLIPAWGVWIPARIIGDFFANVLFQLFYTLFAPLFGERHIVDVYAIFNAILFSLIFLAASLASFQYSKLYINLERKYLFFYSLVFYVLYIPKIGLSNLTLMMSYDVPVVMGIWFVYPFIAYITTKEDPFKCFKESSAIIFIGIFGYFVSFSATNVEVFVVLVLALCTIYLFLENKLSNPEEDIVSAFKSLKDRPKWFIFGIFYIPVVTGIAFIYDINGGRYIAEKNQRWGNVSNEGITIEKSISDLNLGFESPLCYFVIIAVLLFIFRVLISIKKDNKKILNSYEGRAASIVIILLSLIFYFIFLKILTGFGLRNYFLHTGFSSFYHFFIALAATTSIFFFNKNIAASLILSLSIVIISFNGIKKITNPPVNMNISIEESRNVFNSMYMSYCFGSEKVPVFMRNPTYPYVPIPIVYKDNWFGRAHGIVFSQYVIKDDSVEYYPTYYSVSSVNELQLDLAKFRDKGENRCLDISDSDYYIHLGG